MSINVDFDWYRAFSEDGSAGYEHSRDKIREVGRKTEPYRLVDDSSTKLFLTFAGLDERSPDACVNFANRWGFLKVQQFDRNRTESLSDWVDGIKSMKRSVAQLRDKERPRGSSLSGIGTSAALFLRFGDPNPSLVLRPETLLDAMRIQMAQFFTAGNELADCAECGKAFAIGIGVRKRADSRFCSDACRFRYHNKRRAGK
jgi:hypothetical protein